jgi:bla regulator protein blaR1
LRAAFVALFALAGIAAAGQLVAHAQTQSPNSQGFEFEVASIKPSDPNSKGGSLSDTPGTGRVDGRFGASNIPLMILIRSAYGLPLKGSDDRLQGAPGWLSSERYDIEAKMDDETVDALNKLSGDERKAAVQQMVLKLFAERCRFAAHSETRDLSLYTLVIGKNGSKLREDDSGAATDDGSARGAKPSGMRMMGRGGPLVGQGVPISMLVTALAAMTGRTVVDKTGLTGKYDFSLQWSPDDNPGANLLKDSGTGSSGDSAAPALDSNFPSLFTAIQQQLGLKLEAGKGPVEVIVIDHIERPSAN